MAIECVRLARGSASTRIGSTKPRIPASFGKTPFAFRTGGRLITSSTITTLKNRAVRELRKNREELRLSNASIWEILRNDPKIPTAEPRDKRGHAG